MTSLCLYLRERAFFVMGLRVHPRQVSRLLLLFAFLLAAAAGVVAQTSIFQSTNGSNSRGNDGSALELGMKFRSTQSGYITGIRYYKPSGTTGVHIGNLWTSSGTLLASATFANESASGWQQVLFNAPVAINANTTYVASYFSSSGDYSVTNPYFTTATVNGSLRALASGEDGVNGLYRYTSSSAFPNSNYQTSNYWVDVVFTTNTGPDVTPPGILSATPVNGSTGVSVNITATAFFNEVMNASTISSSTIELRNASNTLIPATVSYSSGAMSATITPDAALASSTTYTVTVKGGSSGVKDAAGNALASNYSWSFTTGAPPPSEGNGGPILVISSSANPFSRYAVEILRAEGLNGFIAMDISAVNATILNNYDVVVLGEMTVTASQVSMLTNWVNAGGVLIAFKPSALLTPLMGLSNASGTLADKYLLVNTSTGPGVGIVSQTIQFHGTANLHTLNGAASIATLYSSATAATSNPAVTTINVGSNGGKAVAFTYDLAKSVVYTRQGDPSKAGVETDGVSPVRPDDLFFPSYLDMNKVAIPQADEQQRLLANIIIQSNLSKKPLPRFWYMPKGYKAAVVFALDDHGTFSGTKDVFDKMIANSPSGCSIDDWECYRATSWFYVGIPLTSAQANTYNSQGFEMGTHVQNGCMDFSSFSNLDAYYNTQFQQFKNTYPNLPPQTTHRFHCLVWSDWITQAKVELSRGVRLSLDYYYWPPEWINGRPGLFTGSGMPMRFADTDGSIIDIYQGVSQLVNENGISYATDFNTVLDRALGSEGYYGFFGAHDDYRDQTFSTTAINSAKARNVPIITAKQLLTWLDGRNGSYFGAMTWNGNQLTVPITAISGARNLKCMLPYNSATGNLVSITRNGSSLSFTTQTIKGIQYAFFDVASGTANYVATYTGGGTAPALTTHPAAQTVCAGNSVTFTSAASGTPTPTVQWQVSTDGGSNWSNISGATSSPLTFTAATGDNNKRYRAVWTNSQGVANSSAAILTVNAVPAAPSVSVTNNCESAVLTASGYTGSLLWNTGATTASITVASAGTYTVTQTVNGCTSATGSGTTVPKTVPAAPVVNVVNNCGNSVLTAGNYSGTLLWSTGEASSSITVATAGTYTVTQTVNGCTSTAGSGVAAPKTIPAAPTVNVVNNCGNSVLTATNYTGSLLWSNGATTASITVTTAGSYTVAQTINGCTSATGSGTAAPKAIPAAPAVNVVNDCGSSVLTADNYTGSLQWSNGATTASITVTAAGTYTVTQTVNGCTSAAGNAVAAPKAIPSAPTVSVVDNCGSSVLTAGNFAGSLLWSNGANTASITVTAAGAYTVTQTVNGCTSAAGNAVAAPKAIPSTPAVSVADNCGNSVLTAGNYTGSLLWSTGETTASITVAAGGTYTVTQTVNGCISSQGSGNANPSPAPPAPAVSVVNDCGVTVLTASGYTGSLLWSTGETTASITVNTPGTYTVTQTVGSCISTAGSGLAAPKPVPAAPAITVINNCNSSELIATNYAGSLVWNTSETTASITVTAAGTYTVMQTVDGCSSGKGTGVAAPKTIPPAPVVNVTDNCGNSVLTATNFTGSLLWSTGEMTISITVNTAGTYSVTQTVDGCTSATGSGIATPKTLPSAPAVNVVNNCGSSVLTATNYTGSLLWSTGETTASITVTPGGVYTVAQTVNGCTSTAGSGTAAPKAIPAAPIVIVSNNCGSSQLLAGNYTGTLLWSTGATTPSITVTTGGTYTVTQTVNGCTGSAGSGLAEPIISTAPAPTVSVVNNCGNSVLTAGNYTGSIVWSTGATTPSITVTTPGAYTVAQLQNGCAGEQGTGIAVPKPAPPAPAVSVLNSCGHSVLTAENYTGSLLWSTGETTPSVTVTTGGVYAVTQTVDGCTSSTGSGTAMPKVIPPAPTVGVLNGCGSSVLTAENYTGSLLWSTGETTASITVTASGTYTVTQTINGCTSAAGSGLAAPVTTTAPAPTVTVENNCGSSVLTAGNYTGSLLWSTGETTTSVTVTTAGTYTVVQTINGCPGLAGSGEAEPKATPAAPAVDVVDNCGSSTLTATNYAGSLLWSTGETTASITVAAGGIYTVTQTVNGCTGAEGNGLASPKAIPSAPAVSVANNCGSSVLTATNYTGSLLWSTGETTQSVTVTTGGVYTVTQTVDGCTSTAGSGLAEPVIVTAPAPSVAVENNCGSSVLTAANYTGSLLWSNGETTASITVITAGTYTVAQTIDGCPGLPGSGEAAPKTIPAAPSVTVENNCGSSVLTAANYAGSLLWSTGETTASITVTTGGTYTVTQTANGCTSATGSGLAEPKTIPAAPFVNVADNCGSSVLTAENYTGSLLWSTGETTASITVTTGGAYTVTQTVNGCTSPDAGSGIAAPKEVPAKPGVSVENACGSSVLTAANYTGSLLWSTGETTASITVVTGGVYTVTQTTDGCASQQGSGIASPNSMPSAPAVTVQNNCEQSVLTAIGYTGSLLWSTGETTASITVNTGGTYTVTQTINGCTSAAGSGIAAPGTGEATKPVITPGGPTTFCTGGSVTLTSSLPTGNVWSNGATTQSIVVNASGSYTVQAVNGGSCAAPSDPVVVTVNPKPAGSITAVSLSVCDYNEPSVVFNAGSGTAPYSVVINGTTYNNVNNGASISLGNTLLAGTSLWTNSTVPSIAVENDGQPLEVGMKFRVSSTGFIKSIRFYKGSNNDAGTYVLKLYLNSSRTLLSSVNFSNRTATGWQTVDLPVPVAVTAGTTYLVSYYSPNGNYANNLNYFTSARTVGALTGLANGTDGSNGVYRYGAGGGYPTNTYRSSNYWVDVVYVTPLSLTFNLTSITDANNCTTSGSLGSVSLQITPCSGLLTRNSMEDKNVTIPEEPAPLKARLGQNHPNPFEVSSLVDFDIPKTGKIRLALYDINGRQVEVLLDEVRNAGSYTIPVRRHSLAAGIYYYRLEFEGQVLVKKMMIL